MNKSIYCFILLCSFINEVEAQDWLWARQSKQFGLSEGEAETVTTDPSGNVYELGWYEGDAIIFGLDTVFNPNCCGEILLMKYDSLGNVLWVRNTSGTASSFGRGLGVDDSGNVFIAGSFSNGTLTFNAITINNPTFLSDIFIAKFDSSGNALWAKSQGGTGTDQTWDLTTDHLGNAYITGVFNSPILNFDTYSLTPSGIWSLFLVKYNKDGNVQWIKSANGTEDDEGEALATDGDNNVYLSGFFSSPVLSFGVFNLSLINSNDIFLVKYDPEGNEIWAKSAGGNAGEEGFALTTDNDDNIYVTGNFNSHTLAFDTITLTNPSFPFTLYNFYLAKYDSSGNIIWARNAEGDNEESYGWAVATDDFGNVFVSGSVNLYPIIFGTDTLYQPTGDPMFIVKYDSLGNVLCAESIPSGGEDRNGLDADKLGNAYIGGDFIPTPFILGADTLINTTGAETIFLAKWTCPDCIKTLFFADADGDGFGNSLIASLSCDIPVGYVVDNTDCNDADNLINPDAIEICNSFDDNCNFLIDEDLIFTTYYIDADGDLFGDVLIDSLSCLLEIPGYVSDSTDCNDANNLIFPGGDEICDGLDNDCDGVPNDNLDFAVYYQDNDDDAYGNSEIDSISCLVPSGFVLDSTDCDDTNPFIYPGAPEIPDGIDDNCNQLIDEGVEVDEITNTDFNIYPNPNDGNFQIITHNINSETFIVEIFDVRGNKIKFINTTQSIPLYLSDIVNGIYLLRITTNNNASYYNKLIIAK